MTAQVDLVDFVAGTGDESAGELLDRMRSIDRTGNGWVNIRPRPEDDPDPVVRNKAREAITTAAGTQGWVG